jgi:hypothetical protein
MAGEHPTIALSLTWPAIQAPASAWVTAAGRAETARVPAVFAEGDRTTGDAVREKTPAI